MLLHQFSATVAIPDSNNQHTYIIWAKDKRDAESLLNRKVDFDQYIEPMKDTDVQVVAKKPGFKLLFKSKKIPEALRVEAF